MTTFVIPHPPDAIRTSRYHATRETSPAPPTPPGRPVTRRGARVSADSTAQPRARGYRLTDRYLDPLEIDTDQYTERSIRLPGCYWCYSRPDLPLEALPATDRRPGPPTFGCLNNFAKISAETLCLWMRLLQRVAEARLIIHARDKTHQIRVLRALREFGLPDSRVTFVGKQPFHAYLDTYRDIDVALDPWPFGGGTTTCDALWMGVPVVSLTGSTAVSRAGLSLLSHVGLADLVATSAERYLDLAEQLIRDGRRIAELRRELRGRLESSIVMDSFAFTRGLETAYRSMWRTWCERSDRQGRLC